MRISLFLPTASGTFFGIGSKELANIFLGYGKTPHVKTGGENRFRLRNFTRFLVLNT